MESMGGGDNHRMSSDIYPSKSYALSGKIMLSAIVILFAVVVFMICLHLYARWYLRRARRRHRRNRRTHLVFYMEPNHPASAVSAAARGLDDAVLKTLPVFVYSAENHPGDAVLECAVCLSELEENEKVRLLPKCKHSFHIDCIDMWFHSHSTCPICRSPVEPPVPENRSDIVIGIDEPGSSSGLCATCQHVDSVSLVSPETLADRRKAFQRAVAAIELPQRRNESGPSSPAIQGYRSPTSRLMSLKRILSMNRKGTSPAVSPSAGIGTSCGFEATELDIESGRSESNQQ